EGRVRVSGRGGADRGGWLRAPDPIRRLLRRGEPNLGLHRLAAAAGRYRASARQAPSLARQRRPSVADREPPPEPHPRKGCPRPLLGQRRRAGPDDGLRGLRVGLLGGAAVSWSLLLRCARWLAGLWADLGLLLHHA